MNWPWHVLNGEDLRDLLRRAHEGENPEILYLEVFADADERENFGDDDE